MNNYKIQRDERENINYEHALSKTIKWVFLSFSLLVLASTFIDLYNKEISIVSILLITTLLLISIYIIITLYKYNAHFVTISNENSYKNYLKKIKIILFTQAIAFALLFYSLFSILPNYVKEKSINFDIISLISDIIFMLVIAIILYFIERKRIIKD